MFGDAHMQRMLHAALAPAAETASRADRCEPVGLRPPSAPSHPHPPTPLRTRTALSTRALRQPVQAVQRAPARACASCAAAASALSSRACGAQAEAARPPDEADVICSTNHRERGAAPNRACVPLYDPFASPHGVWRTP